MGSSCSTSTSDSTQERNHEKRSPAPSSATTDMAVKGSKKKFRSIELDSIIGPASGSSDGCTNTTALPRTDDSLGACSSENNPLLSRSVTTATSPAIPILKVPDASESFGGTRRLVNMPLCDSAVPVSTLSETDLATLAFCPVSSHNFPTQATLQCRPGSPPRSSSKSCPLLLVAGCDTYEGLSSSSGFSPSSMTNRQVGFTLPE